METDWSVDGVMNAPRPLFEARLWSPDNSVTMVPVRERATGQMRQVVVGTITCEGCGGVHLRPLSLQLDLEGDERRFDPPFGMPHW